jgi:hypothetical protein
LLHNLFGNAKRSVAYYTMLMLPIAEFCIHGSWAP